MHARPTHNFFSFHDLNSETEYRIGHNNPAKALPLHLMFGGGNESAVTSPARYRDETWMTIQNFQIRGR